MTEASRISSLLTLFLSALLLSACSGGSSSNSSGSGSGSSAQQPPAGDPGSNPPSVTAMQPDDNAVSASISTVVAATFSEPLDFREDGQIVLRLDVAAWVASFEDADSDALAARDAWLNLGAAVEVER